MAKSPDVNLDAGSRVIVKNVPIHATEKRLRETFAPFGEVTDCRVKLTKDGRSRQFAFVGFRNAAEAKEAVNSLNKSFFDTARISVELAHAPGSEAIARPWSRYATGSSAHKRLAEKLEEKKASKDIPGKIAQVADTTCKRTTNRVVPPSGAKAVNTCVVKPTKAGVSNQRVHVEFGSDSENDNEEIPSIKTRAAANKTAFDDDLDDLAYLRAKASKQSDKSPTELTVDENPVMAPAVSSTHPAKVPNDNNATTPGAVKTAKKKKRKTKSTNMAEGAMADDLVAETSVKIDSSKVEAAKSLTIEEEAKHDEDREELETSGRLYVTNVPYGATDDEVRAHFEPLGEVSSVHLCRDEDSLKSRGFAYVSYVFPECALRALTELDMKSFQGRLLRVAGAKARPPPLDAASSAPKGGGTSSYKRRLAEKQKKVDAHLEHTWNLLYVSASAAADVAAQQLGVSKSDLFGKDAENAAVTSALTETSVLQQTKRWLQREGVRVEAFEQSGANLAQCRARSAEGEVKRRQDSFIVKHLPAGANTQELHERFARCGELVRCSVAPSGTVAIVQYAENASAQRAFQKLAFSKYKHAPLYLEWAPEDVFIDGAKPPALLSADDAKEGGDEADGDDDDGGDATTSLFVKNLSFSTTDEGLKSAFRGCKGLRSAVVMRKKAAVVAGKQASKGGSDDKGQSMGYGFVEFASAAHAKEAIKRKQGIRLDGHGLQLQISQRVSNREGRTSVAGNKKNKSGTLVSPRLCVRNLAFEVKNSELRQLFSAYGSLTSVRIPKKANYDGHRGFAFIDFASKAEAAAAFEALQHTHLYGRRMVIEPAEEKATDVATVQQVAQKRQASKGLRSEAHKRRRASVLNTAKDAESFADAMIA